MCIRDSAIAPRIKWDISNHKATQKATEALPAFYKGMVEIDQKEILLQRYGTTVFSAAAGGLFLLGTESFPVALSTALATKVISMFALAHPQNTAIERMEIGTSNKSNAELLEAWHQDQIAGKDN